MASTLDSSTHPDRLDAPERRETLLDIARCLVEEGGPSAVTMGTVADRTGVTRALVYKHFANRDDILSALYQREAAALDHSLRKAVTEAPDGFEPKLQAFIASVDGAVRARGAFFIPLRPFGRTSERRAEQRLWDRRTAKYFAGLAADELGLDAKVAQRAVSVLLAGIVSQLTQGPSPRGARQRAERDHMLVRLAVGGLQALADEPVT